MCFPRLDRVYVKLPVHQHTLAYNRDEFQRPTSEQHPKLNCIPGP